MHLTRGIIFTKMETIKIKPRTTIKEAPEFELSGSIVENVDRNSIYGIATGDTKAGEIVTINFDRNFMVSGGQPW